MGKEKKYLKRKLVSGIMLAWLIFSLISVYIIGVTAQETHDIAVVHVTPSRTSVRLCELVNITVVVENQGTENETFDVTVYYDNTAIEMKTTSNLTTGINTFLTFTWNTTSVTEEVYTSPGHRKTYAIKATVSTVAGETDVEDNTRV
jgi:hypothetical protein